MKRILYIFSLLLILVVGVGCDGHKVAMEDGVGDENAILEADGSNDKDRLYDATPVPPKHEALLSSRLDTVQAGSQRVRRVIPSTGYHSGNAAAKCATNNNLAVLFMAKGWQSRLSALPQICLTVRYYVIALRHILR